MPAEGSAEGVMPLFLSARPKYVSGRASGIRVLAVATEHREANGPAWRSELISFVLIGPGMN